MPSSLPILSWAKAAGASARLSETSAAETPRPIRVVNSHGLVILVGSFDESDVCRFPNDDPGIGLRYRL